MNQQNKTILFQCMKKLITEENLLQNGATLSIKFRRMVVGAKTRAGVLRRNRKTNRYTIILHEILVKYIPNPTGEYISRITKEKLSRSAKGEELTDESVIETAAHKMAHLKYWSHNHSHRNYTNYLHKKLTEEIENEKRKIQN